MRLDAVRWRRGCVDMGEGSNSVRNNFRSSTRSSLLGLRFSARRQRHRANCYLVRTGVYLFL
jgi:hypothetical protein